MNQAQEIEQSSKLIEFGVFQLHMGKKQILYFGEVQRRLTNREFELLEYFINNPNRLVTKSELATKVWSKDDHKIYRSIDVFIVRLREYIVKEGTKVQIKTHFSEGWEFICENINKIGEWQ